MWNLKVQFEELDNAVDFLNKVRKIDDVEYRIEKENKLIYVSGSRSYNKVIVEELLSEAIVRIYKTKYFFNNINLLGIPKECRDSLIKALILLDIDSDIYYVQSLINEDATIIIPSFNAFKLKKLQNKWHEFIFVINLNSNYILNYEGYIEFLKLLISCIDPKTNIVNLKSDLSKFLIIDDNDLINYQVDLNDEVGLITHLALLAPQNINIYCVEQMDNKIFKTLYYLFDKKINLIV